MTSFQNLFIISSQYRHVVLIVEHKSHVMFLCAYYTLAVCQFQRYVELKENFEKIFLENIRVQYELKKFQVKISILLISSFYSNNQQKHELNCKFCYKITPLRCLLLTVSDTGNPAGCLQNRGSRCNSLLKNMKENGGSRNVTVVATTNISVRAQPDYSPPHIAFIEVFFNCQNTKTHINKYIQTRVLRYSSVFV